MADDQAIADYAGDKPADAGGEKLCTEGGCGYVARGRTAAALLGAHKRTVHGIAGAGAHKRAAKKTEVRDVEAGGATLAAVRDIADGIGKRKGVPTADDLARGFGRGLGIISTAVASYAVETDETIPEGPDGDAQRDALVSYLSLSDRAARQVMEPPAKAFAPTKLNRRFGRQVVDNVDVAASVAELAILGAHWRRYFRGRHYRQDQQAPRSPIDVAAVQVVPPTAEQAQAQAAAEGMTMTSPAPQGGTVWTPEMVQAARARG